tara:strand:+ start:764 stop:1042 length:279 start_codon:yes stop_codon:yes gene_type:complete
MGRLVENHSTYLEGLLGKLQKLTNLKEIKTITPGIIKRTRGRSTVFRIKISKEIRGGYKLLARKGKTAQEVYLITNLSREVLEKYLREIDES